MISTCLVLLMKCWSDEGTAPTEFWKRQKHRQPDIRRTSVPQILVVMEMVQLAGNVSVVCRETGFSSQHKGFISGVRISHPAVQWSSTRVHDGGELHVLTKVPVPLPVPSVTKLRERGKTELFKWKQIVPSCSFCVSHLTYLCN
ncbi:hypothetical protein AMECASPLE_022589 [Ameca splendens]|uniref:Uncharacterized protein n=1 Tax=Ameca splendens TaxID=208324 RepID=A0ABV0ZEM6_9TELE